MVIFLGVLLDRVRRHQAGTLLALAAGFVVAGAVLFSATQHIPFTTGLYWAVTTATTVGYGDVTPHNGAGRVVAVGEMLTAIPVFGAAFALLAAVATATRLRRLMGLDHHLRTGFVAIYGTNSFVPRIVDALTSTGAAVLVVDDIEPGRYGGRVSVLRGDPTSEDVLVRSKPQQASRALVTAPDDSDVLIICALLRHLAPDLEIVATADSAKIARTLRDLGLGLAVSAEDLLGATLAKSLEAPHAGELLLNFVDSDRYRLREVTPSPAEVGQPLSAVRDSREGLVLGAVQGGRVTLGLEGGVVIADGDALLVMEHDPGGSRPVTSGAAPPADP